MTNPVMDYNNSDEKLSDLERKLKEGRDVELTVNRNSANISVLSSPRDYKDPGEISAKSSYSDGDDNIEGAEIASRSNEELYEHTERLLAKMSELNTSHSKLTRGEPEGSYDENEELNAMLDKAGQLSSMMQSISENLSMNGDTPSLVRKSDQLLKEAGYIASGSSPNVGEDTPNLVRQSEDLLRAAGYKESPKNGYQQDPPGNHTTNKTNNESPRLPASSVNVVQSMDDDVSSVGSASFMFNSRNQRSQQKPQATKDFELFTDTHDREMVDSENENANEIVPSLQEEPQSDFNMASSPRDATVQWEKVSTAKDGEDDYVPLVDYSHVKVARKAAASTTGSRLEKVRKRNAARRRGRMRTMAVLFLIAASGLIYFTYFSRTATAPEMEDIAEVEMEPEEPIDTFQSYDTSFLQGIEHGFCFEAEGDESIMITFPKIKGQEEEPVVEEVVVQEKPKRGFFGRRKK